MLPRIRQFFAAPIFESEEKTRTARILNIFGWFVVGIVSLLFGYRLITDNWVNISSKLILPFILIATLVSLALLRRGYVRSAAGISVTFIWSAIAWQAYQAEGLRSASIIAHLAIILFSSLLLGWRSGLVYGVLSIALIWLLAFQEQTGIRFFVDTPPFDFARSLTIIFIATGVLIYLLIHHLNRSLAEARLELKERLRADEKLRLQTQYLTTLHETALGLINRLELTPLLESILDRVSELMDTPHVGIDLLTPDETVFKQELGKGMFLDFNGDATGIGVGLVGKVWESGRTILTEDYSKYPNRRQEAEEAGFGAVLGTPLKSGNKVVGSLLVAHTDKQKKFTQEQVVLLERLAALASVAIDNARLYEEAHKEIAERKQVEQDLRSSEGRFRKVFNNENIAISIVTLEEGTFLEANDAFWRLTGLSPQQALGHSSLEFDLWNRPEDRARFVQELLEKGSLQNVEVEFPGRDHSSKTSIAFYELITIKDQLCILCMFYDITEQKQAQVALRSAEARTRAILESIPDMIFEVSKDGIFLDFMASADATPLVPPSEFIGRNIKDIFPPSIAEQSLFSLERAITTGQLHAFEYGLPPGDEVQFFEARIASITPESAIIMVRDISQRKWVETEREKLIHELEEKNAESETLRESTAIVVETLDETRAVSLILEQLEKVIPYNSASVQLLNADLLEIVSVRGLEPPEEHIGKKFKVNEIEPSHALLKGMSPYVLFEDVQLSSPAFQNSDLHRNIHAWLAIPLKVKGQIIGIIALDGHRIGQFSKKHAELAVTYASQVAIALENARLFSELQAELAERKKLIEELENKNAELERFTYTVSHDLKSPLITIKGFLGFLEQDATRGNFVRLRSDVQRIADATDKMQTLLGELLELSRIGRVVNPHQNIPFAEIVQEAQEMVHGRLHANQIRIMVQDGLPDVYGDRQRLVEVLQNLIDNAAKFFGSDSERLIEIGQDGYEDDKPIFHVRDHGVGIDPVHHDRIFGLFNKLDVDSEGTGVGLALVKRIIEVHGCRIWVQSEAGKGATFYFTLPTQPHLDS